MNIRSTINPTNITVTQPITRELSLSPWDKYKFQCDLQINAEVPISKYDIQKIQTVIPNGSRQRAKLRHSTSDIIKQYISITVCSYEQNTQIKIQRVVASRVVYTGLATEGYLLGENASLKRQPYKKLVKGHMRNNISNCSCWQSTV